MMRVAAVLAIALALVGVSALAGITPAVMWGAHVDFDGNAEYPNIIQAQNEVLFLESLIGRPLAIDSTYTTFDWYGDIAGTLAMAQWDITNGRTPMLTWGFNIHGMSPNCPQWNDIQAGVYDAQLAAQGQALAALGAPIIIRLYPAMDSAAHDCPYGGISDPTIAGPRFLVIWNHIVDLVRAQGATNVLWDWSPNIHAFVNGQGNPITTWQYFEPTADRWDWTGSQVYQNAPADIQIQTYAPFLNFYSQAAALGKPIIFSETGSVGPDPQVDDNGYGCPGQTVGALPHSPSDLWIWSVGGNMPSYPAVKAIVYFDALGETGQGACVNDILRGDGLFWFTQIGLRPYFRLMEP